MTQNTPSCPLSRQEVVDLYFMEHRAKVLDVAAFLDRIERTDDDGDQEDFRVSALKKAVEILIDGKGGRAQRVLEVWSDPTADPYPSAGIKGASGAYGGPVPPAQ